MVKLVLLGIPAMIFTTVAMACFFSSSTDLIEFIVRGDNNLPKIILGFVVSMIAAAISIPIWKAAYPKEI